MAEDIGTPRRGNLVLRHVTSKRQKEIEVALGAVPMLTLTAEDIETEREWQAQRKKPRHP